MASAYSVPGILLAVTAMVVAGAVIAYARTGSPTFHTKPVGTLTVVLVGAVLPLALGTMAWTSLRLHPDLGWVTGVPLLLVAVTLITVVSVATGDYTAGGCSVLLITVMSAAYHLRPVWAWVAALLVTVSATINQWVLLNTEHALRAMLVVGVISASMTRLLVAMRDRQDAVEDALAAQADTDVLTGAASRRVFEREAGERLAESHPDGLALLLLDLDGFKAINDRHGHLVGDRALREVVKAVAARLGPADLICRLGGDEFAVLVPGDDAAALARRDAVAGALAGATLRLDDGTVLPLRASVGLAHLYGGTIERLYALADKDLYTAKGATGNATRAIPSGS